MKKLILIAIMVMAAVAPSALAQGKNARQQWMSEMRQYKRAYLAKELDLTKEQQNKFFPLYEAMEDECARLDEDTRLMERRIADASDATDLEYEKAADTMYDTKVRQAEIEKEYAAKFKEVLSAKQYFNLKDADRKFARDMMRQHHRLRGNARAAEKARE
ncbi:MAG: hypothetical protein NC210_03160 [[Clostridium] fimetarium]|nr:hypothetical protein [Alistipes timonensis]MCM1405401.1 hypothetical protein [[Clostridium] fimetarium]